MRDIAVWTMIGVAVVIGLVDGYLLLHGEPGDSLSGRLRELARLYPVIPFVAGGLIAHLFGF